MLRELSIQNYRAFSHFELDELALVNLIVGMNNSGKSTLLEAIYLLSSDDATDSLLHILHERGEVINNMAAEKWGQGRYQLAHLFHGHTLNPSPTNSIQIIGRYLQDSDPSGTPTSPVPLTSMGDGMRRILAITASLVSVEGGTLLVDEIDTGLYYETLVDMWKLVFSVASKTKTQVFATTHSWDCVQAFQQALTELSDRRIGQLVRLDRGEQKIQPVIYSAEELDIAIRQRIEVR